MAMLVLSIVPLAFAQAKQNQQRAGSGLSGNSEDITEPSVVLVSSDNETVEEETTKPKKKKIIAKQKSNGAKETYTESRQKVLKAKLKLTDCKGKKSEECTQLKENSRMFLVNAADKVLLTLGKIKAKVEASEDLTDEEQSEILADIGESISEIENAKSVIENLDENSTAEEIQEAAKTIKSSWEKTVSTSAKKSVGKLTNAKIHGIVVRSEKLETKLETMLERLDEQGYDITVAEGYLDDFKAEVDEAGENYEAAREQYKQSGKVNQANVLMKTAHKDLQEAHKILKDLLKSIRETKETDAHEDEADN